MKEKHKHIFVYADWIRSQNEPVFMGTITVNEGSKYQLFPFWKYHKM